MKHPPKKQNPFLFLDTKALNRRGVKSLVYTSSYNGVARHPFFYFAARHSHTTRVYIRHESLHRLCTFQTMQIFPFFLKISLDKAGFILRRTTVWCRDCFTPPRDGAGMERNTEPLSVFNEACPTARLEI